MTTLVVLQPGYLPWIGYFDLLQKADVFVHYDDVQFDKIIQVNLKSCTHMRASPHIK